MVLQCSIAFALLLSCCSRVLHLPVLSIRFAIPLCVCTAILRCTRFSGCFEPRVQAIAFVCLHLRECSVLTVQSVVYRQCGTLFLAPKARCVHATLCVAVFAHVAWHVVCLYTPHPMPHVHKPLVLTGLDPIPSHPFLCVPWGLRTA